MAVTTVPPAKGAAATSPASGLPTPAAQPADFLQSPTLNRPAAATGRAKSAARAGPQPLQSQTTIVNVFATVRDKHHGIISDLTKDDFKVFEDGVEQKVAFFSKEVNMPITLGLLIDTSASMDRMIDAEQDAASRFLREVMRPKDEAMVMTFDFDVDLLADFTQDTSAPFQRNPAGAGEFGGRRRSGDSGNDSARRHGRHRFVRRDLPGVPRPTSH